MKRKIIYFLHFIFPIVGIAQVDSIKSDSCYIEKWVDIFVQIPHHTLKTNPFLGERTFFVYEFGIGFPVCNFTILKKQSNIRTITGYRKVNFYSWDSNFRCHYINFGLSLTSELLQKGKMHFVWSSEANITGGFKFEYDSLVDGLDLFEGTRGFHFRFGPAFLFEINNKLSIMGSTKISFGVFGYSYDSYRPRREDYRGVVTFFDDGVFGYYCLNLRYNFCRRKK